ncbi:hypothetical protein D918_07888 [Trichuris suis]|nr:hypothetical protein D918_07888 [Trichuris suis]
MHAGRSFDQIVCKGFSPYEIQYVPVDKAVTLAKLLGVEGFDDTTEEEVNTLIDAHSEPLTVADLEELTKSASEEDVEGDRQMQRKNRTRHGNVLSEILRTPRNVLNNTNSEA